MFGLAKFLTFYSYKGGVGRTSSLVNTAILRANEGNRVVLVDFDLEAPGVSSYIGSLDPSFNFNRKGILEYLISYLDHRDILNIRDNLALDFSHLISKENGGGLWIITSGDVSDKSYAKNLERINWVEIFKEHKGDLLLKNLKRQIEEELAPDYVFIDSRTGITETGGICTKYLADSVVMLTSLNKQNIIGTSGIYHDIKDEEKKFIFVASNVPVGMPLSNGSLLEERYKAFETAFNAPPDVIIYNYPTLSLSEDLPVMLSITSHDEAKKIFAVNDPLQQSYQALSARIHSLYSDTYLKLVEKASDEMLYQSGIGAEVYQHEMKRLEGNFPDRHFTRIMKRFFDYMQLVADESQDLQKIDIDEFTSFVSDVSTCTNSIIKKSLRHFKFQITNIVTRRSDVEIDENISKLLLDENMTLHAAVREMGKQRFVWPMQFFNMRVQAEKPNPELSDLFNLAICKYNVGQIDRALLDEIVEKSKDVSQIRSPENRANFKACIGFALEILGQNESAVKNYKEAIEAAKEVDEDEEIFTPFSYNDVSTKEFISSLVQKLDRLSSQS